MRIRNQLLTLMRILIQLFITGSADPDPEIPVMQIREDPDPEIMQIHEDPDPETMRIHEFPNPE
jgi:hypothetical protein